MLYQARTYLELQIGETHSIELTLNIRYNDLNWWNSNTKSKEKQLFKIIRRQILPIECSEYLDYQSVSSNTDNAIAKVNIGNNRRNIVIGDRNKRNSKDVNNKQQQARKKQRKEIGDGNKSNTEAMGNTTAKKSSNKNQDTNRSPTKNKKDESITFLFGETIQITYKVKEIKTYDSITLNYSNNNNDSNTFAFIEYKKIPKQLQIWCYPFDIKNPTQTNVKCSEHDSYEGFYRPEFIPITSNHRLKNDENDEK